MSGDDSLGQAAMQAGADAFLSKPLASVSEFQKIVLDLLPNELQPPSLSKSQNDAITPDPMALRDDLALAADLLRSNPDAPTLDYLGGFLSSLGKDAGDAALAQLAKLVHDLGKDGSTGDERSKLAQKVEERMKKLQPV